MGIVYALLILIIIFGSIGIVYVINYNKLQECKVKIDESESIIDENLRAKYDIIIRAENLIKNTIKEEKINFKDLKNIKEENISNFDLERKLEETMLLLSKVRNDFPELDAIKDFRTLMNDIKRIDEKIDAAKHYYNKYTSESNELVRKFPSNIIAKLHDISLRTYFDNKNMDDDDINDFKL